MSTFLAVISLLPGGLMMFALLVSMFCFLVWYAIYKRGYVRAEMSHGKTVFKLEVKDQRADRKNGTVLESNSMRPQLSQEGSDNPDEERDGTQ